MVIIGMCDDDHIEISDFLFLEIRNQAILGDIYLDVSTGVDEKIMISEPDKGTVSLSDIDEGDFLMKGQIRNEGSGKDDQTA